VAAYVIDSLFIQVVTSLGFFGLVAVLVTGEMQGEGSVVSSILDVWFWLQTGVWFAYFAVTEAYWGRGLGKRCMGLRVVGPDGDRPGLLRSTLRSFVVPGTMRLVGSPCMLALLNSVGLLTQRSPGFQWQETILTLMPYAFLLLCTTSMRSRNGYRGWHELASGTRVVRLRAAAARHPRTLGIPVVLPVVTRDGARTYGPFRLGGFFGHCGKLDVADATDDLLGRAVWIYRGPRATAIPDGRRRVVRPTRPHWLQGGEVADERWDAFEAVTGAPLTDIAWVANEVAWQESRHWLLELCEELAAAIADGTLPEVLSLAQIWIGRDGRLKLLDAPLAPMGSAVFDGAKYGGPPADRALDLLRAAIVLCTREQILPPQVADFLEELAPSALAGQETLIWAASRLRELITQPAALDWRGRLGALAVSMGTELLLYAAVAVLVPVLLVITFRWPIERMAMLAPVALLLPALIGHVCRGGPAFWLAHIKVLYSDGRRAGRWRCAWLPLMLFCEMYMGLSLSGFGREVTEDVLKMFLTLGGFFVGLMFGLVFVFGAVQSLLSPQRGFQDELSGTWLAPE
jgi:uncharacterized RDD family membrane protein YckC